MSIVKLSLRVYFASQSDQSPYSPYIYTHMNSFAVVVVVPKVHPWNDRVVVLVRCMHRSRVVAHFPVANFRTIEVCDPKWLESIVVARTDSRHEKYGTSHRLQPFQTRTASGKGGRSRPRVPTTRRGSIARGRVWQRPTRSCWRTVARRTTNNHP